MSTVLSKDRKVPELKILKQAEALLEMTCKVYNDESKLPKRQRPLIGARTVNNIYDVYENLRLANEIFPDSKSNINIRLDAAKQAYISANKFCSDINVLPYAINCDSNTRWYLEMNKCATELATGTKNWMNSDRRRMNNRLSTINTEHNKPVKAIIFIDKDKTKK